MKAATLDTAKIWYSASNEDSASEIAALRPAGRRLLSITASGSRSFDLLLADPATILSIDQNPAQTHFAQLLSAAYHVLDYPEFSAFTGLTPGQDRAGQLQRLIPELPAAAQAFWQTNAALVQDGLIYCGKWEAYLRLMQRLAGPRRRRVAARLLAASTRAEQAAIWDRDWDGPGWRAFLTLAALRPVWRWILREPGIAFVPRDFDMRAYAQARFDHAARALDLPRAPFAWLLLAGRYDPAVLPPYLTEAGHAVIRTRLDRISFVTASLQDVLTECAPASFDGASLSDYSSYCDTGVQAGVWASLARAVAPGGRVCERKFFNKSGAKLAEQHGFSRDCALEEQLFAADGAWFYSFIVAAREAGRDG